MVTIRHKIPGGRVQIRRFSQIFQALHSQVVAVVSCPLYMLSLCIGNASDHGMAYVQGNSLDRTM